MDSEHSNLIYRCDASGVTVVDKNEGSYGVITPDVQRALDAKKQDTGSGNRVADRILSGNNRFGT
jgi:hypothetical protein